MIVTAAIHDVSPQGWSIPMRNEFPWEAGNQARLQPAGT